MILKAWTSIEVWNNEEGASLVEYALLVALIALVALAAVNTVGTNIETQFNDIGTCIGDPETCAEGG